MLRPWKRQWPHYVRVHHAEFIAGSLSNGISLNELMDVLKSDSFVPTQRNAANGKGNTDPRKAYMQQASVELSPQAFAWLNERLERAYAEHGKLAPRTLEQLDWPAVATGVANSGHAVYLFRTVLAELDTLFAALRHRVFLGEL